MIFFRGYLIKKNQHNPIAIYLPSSQMAPFRNRRRRKPKRKYQRNNKSTSALRSKRIDTLLEQRMVEISKAQVKKGHQWFLAQKKIAHANFNWQTWGPYLEIPLSSYLGVPAAFLWHQKLTDVGAQLETDLINDPKEKRMYIRISSFRCQFTIQYGGQSEGIVKAFIVSVPGADPSATIAHPSLGMTPGGGLNGLYHFDPSTLRDALDYKFKILAKKTIRLRPGNLYQPQTIFEPDPAHLPIIQPRNPRVVAQNNNSSYWDRDVLFKQNKYNFTLNKAYSGEGKKIVFDTGTVAPTSENMFVCMVSSVPMGLIGTVCTRYRVAKPAGTGQPNLP